MSSPYSLALRSPPQLDLIPIPITIAEETHDRFCAWRETSKPDKPIYRSSIKLGLECATDCDHSSSLAYIYFYVIIYPDIGLIYSVVVIYFSALCTSVCLSVDINKQLPPSTLTVLTHSPAIPPTWIIFLQRLSELFSWGVVDETKDALDKFTSLLALHIAPLLTSSATYRRWIISRITIPTTIYLYSCPASPFPACLAYLDHWCHARGPLLINPSHESTSPHSIEMIIKWTIWLTCDSYRG